MIFRKRMFYLNKSKTFLKKKKAVGFSSNKKSENQK
jgi:hypothetical protein